jgi:hypothetical protein
MPQEKVLTCATLRSGCIPVNLRPYDTRGSDSNTSPDAIPTNKKLKHLGCSSAAPNAANAAQRCHCHRHQLCFRGHCEKASICLYASCGPST